MPQTLIVILLPHLQEICAGLLQLMLKAFDLPFEFIPRQTGGVTCRRAGSSGCCVIYSRHLQINRPLLILASLVVHGNIDPTFLSSRQHDLCAYELIVADGPELHSTNRHDPVTVRAVREITQERLAYDKRLSWFVRIHRVGLLISSKRDEQQTMLMLVDVEDPFEKFQVQLPEATVLF